MSSAETNRALATKFEKAWNTHGMRLFDEIFHPDLQWHVAVTPYGQSEPPVFQSPLLRDQKMIWDKTIMNKQEMMAVFDMTLTAFRQFSIEITSITIEGDTVVAESLGRAVNPHNGRIYDNIYCYVMKVKDGQIILFREYQNTLLVFDVFNES
jgi:ketosteroid isomerase-like protein